MERVSFLSFSSYQLRLETWTLEVGASGSCVPSEKSLLISF